MYDQVKEYVLSLSESFRGFYIEGITKKFNIDAKEAFNFMTILSNNKIISIKYEVRCPDCLRILNIYNNIADIPEQLECIYCGETKDLTTHEVYPYCKILR